jgi:hypothetical protein
LGCDNYADKVAGSASIPYPLHMEVGEMPPPPGEVLVISFKTGFSFSFSFEYRITDFVHTITHTTNEKPNKILSAIMPLLIVHAMYLSEGLGPIMNSLVGFRKELFQCISIQY